MKTKIYLALILFLAIFLRFYQLGSLPSSYTPDEVAQAYTAYSVLKTGHDEWNNSFLLSFRSFGDYKPPIQTLLMIPSVKLFGLTPFALRLPNALFSILTIFFTYLLTLKLFKNTKIALLSSLFMAISPWFLPMSRIALEANLLIFFITSGTYFFLKSQEKNNYPLFVLSLVLFSISLFTYHSTKVFLPLYLIVLFFYSKLQKKRLFSLIFVISLILLFIGQYFVNQQIKVSRTGDIAIFNPTDNWQGVSDNQFEMTKSGLSYPITKIFYNKLVFLFDLFTHNYLSYFSPQFLITNGAGENTYGMISGYGVLGLIPGIGFFYCLFYLLKNFSFKKQSNLILLFLAVLIAPLAASIAKGQYSGNRVSVMMPFIQIISAAGLIFLIESIPKNFQKISSIIFSAIFIYFSLSFLQRYFFQGNQLLSKDMLYGHQQANKYLQQFPNVDRIIYSRKLSEPQAYVTFFNQIDPKLTQQASQEWLKYEQNKLSFLDQLGEYHLGKLTFREINIASDKNLPNTILIGRPQEFLDTKASHIIYYPSASHQEAAIYIYQTSSEK